VIPLHRDEVLPTPGVVDKALTWLTDNVLASRALFLVTLVVPLVALLPAMTKLQAVVIILSSNWLQAWALPAIQRSQNRIQAKQDAKAAVDHHNLNLLVGMVSQLQAGPCHPISVACRAKDEEGSCDTSG
jgi:hypothetical protein